MATTETRRSGPARSGAAPRTSGIFFGWWVVAACFGLAAVSSASGFYGPGIYTANLAAEFGWPRSALSGAVSMYFLASGLVGPVLGRYVDRHGPKLVMIAGGALFGSMIAAQTLVTDIWQIYPVYFLMAMGYAMYGGVTLNAVVARWFARKRGTAMSLAVSGFSIGGAVVVPLAGLVTEMAGWRATFLMMAALNFLIVIPLAALVITGRPQDKGLLPDGDDAPASGAVAAGLPDWTARAAMRTATFWLVVIAWLLGSIAMMGYIANQLAFLKEAGLNTADAAQVVSVTAVCALIGRVTLGILADRLPKRQVAMLFFVLQSVAIGTLLLTGSTPGFFLSAVLFGLAMGGIGTMQPLIMAEAFGVTSFGAIFGWAMLLGTVGMAIGPSFPAAVFDLTQSYRPAWMVLATFGVTAAVIVSFARPPLPRSLSPKGDKGGGMGS